MNNQVIFSGSLVSTSTSSTSNGVTTVTQNPNDRLVKAGAGTLTLAGGGNTYDDGTTILDGVVQVLFGSTLGKGKADHSSFVSVSGNANRNVVLEIQHGGAIDDLMGIMLNSSGSNRGQIALNFNGTETIYGLTIDGVAIAPGTYNSGSAATAGFLTGNGNLEVLTAVLIPEPTSLASLILGAGSLLGMRFRRKVQAV